MRKIKGFALTFLAMLISFGSFAYADGYTKTDNVISTSGGPVGFPGGITAPTTLIGDTYATTFTTTAVAVTNLSTTVAAPTFNAVRVGKSIRMWGLVNVAPVTSATLTTFTLTLPVARSASFIGVGGAVGSARIAGTYSASGTCNGSNNSLTKITCSYTAGTINADSVVVDAVYSIDAN